MTSRRAEGVSGSSRTVEALAAELKSELIAGSIVPGRLMPSERELSRQRGLSKMTVRRALKLLESEGMLLAEPRRGYRVQPRVLDPGRGFPVAFVISPRESELIFALNSQRLIFSEFQRAAAERGWSLLVVGGKQHGYQEVISQLESGRISGAVLASSDPQILKHLTEAGVPVLMVEAWIGGSGADSVVQDGFGGGLQAAEYLLSRGHQRFGWLGLDVRDGNFLVVDRYSGALGGLARAGKSLDRQMTAINCEMEMEKAARELLSGPDRPTAIFALWQSATAGLVRAARELGLKIGQDFDMVGWANQEDYELTYKSLFDNGQMPPAIVWEVARMAETALGRLEERRVNPELPTIQLRIPTTLKLNGEIARPE
jgi:DNA-binding LacI/PurR family transcriptional regulator